MTLQSASNQASDTQYYVPLGDSLDAGVQPDATSDGGPTDEGYTDQLDALHQSSNPRLVQHKLGCPGETTTMMIDGGICGYGGGNLTGYSSDAGSRPGRVCHVRDRSPVMIGVWVSGLN